MRALHDAFEEAEIPTVIEDAIASWMRTHVAWISVFALLSQDADHDVDKARDPARLALCVDAMREAIAVVRATGTPITPPMIRALEVLPRAALRASLGRLAARPEVRAVLENQSAGRLAEAKHMAAQMIALAEDVDHPLTRYRELAAPTLAREPATLPR